MKNFGNIFFGFFLLTVGVLWLSISLDLFDFNWVDLFNLWYWFLIAAGACLVISGFSNNRLAGGIAGIFLTLAIVGGAVTGTGFHRFTPFDLKTRDWNDADQKKQKLRKKRNRRQNNEEAFIGKFGYDMHTGLSTAKLQFQAGAGVFTIDRSSTRLFQANTSSSFINYVSNLRRSADGTIATIDFKMEDAEIDFDETLHENTVGMSLSDSISWELDLKLGAGKGDFDLSQNKVVKLDLKAGAADIRLKLGERAPHSDIQVNAGVAAVHLLIPKQAAVEVVTKGALNSTKLDGLVKVEEDRYRTPDYDESKNTIKIQYQGGISSLKIEQY